MEAVDERLPRRVVDVLGHRGSILGDHAADGLVPAHDDLAPACVSECKPEAVAVPDRDRVEVVEETRVDAVECQEVPAGVEEARPIWLELVEEQLSGGKKRFAFVGDRRVGNPASVNRCECSCASNCSVLAIASSTCGDALMSWPCSSHVYQVTLTPAS